MAPSDSGTGAPFRNPRHEGGAAFTDFIRHLESYLPLFRARGCPETLLLLGSQVIDSACSKLADLLAQKEMFLEEGALSHPSALARRPKSKSEGFLIYLLPRAARNETCRQRCKERLCPTPHGRYLPGNRIALWPQFPVRESAWTLGFS
jgi:hypothetical protein